MINFAKKFINKNKSYDLDKLFIEEYMLLNHKINIIDNINIILKLFFINDNRVFNECLHLINLNETIINNNIIIIKYIINLSVCNINIINDDNDITNNINILCNMANVNHPSNYIVMYYEKSYYWKNKYHIISFIMKMILEYNKL